MRKKFHLELIQILINCLYSQGGKVKLDKCLQIIDKSEDPDEKIKLIRLKIELSKAESDQIDELEGQVKGEAQNLKTIYGTKFL